MGKDKSSKKDRKDKKRKRDKEDEEEYRKSKAEKLVSLQVSKAVAVPFSSLRWPLTSLHAVLWLRAYRLVQKDIVCFASCRAVRSAPRDLVGQKGRQSPEEAQWGSWVHRSGQPLWGQQCHRALCVGQET